MQHEICITFPYTHYVILQFRYSNITKMQYINKLFLHRHYHDIWCVNSYYDTKYCRRDAKLCFLFFNIPPILADFIPHIAVYSKEIINKMLPRPQQVFLKYPFILSLSILINHKECIYFNMYRVWFKYETPYTWFVH